MIAVYWLKTRYAVLRNNMVEAVSCLDMVSSFGCQSKSRSQAVLDSFLLSVFLSCQVFCHCYMKLKKEKFYQVDVTLQQHVTLNLWL